MLISIIVPVYNTEKYLSFAIESLINQTYNDIEIILVNDGSTDRSLEICNYYSYIDRRIRVFSIENSGQSYARNYGVMKSNADFIMFMDSDDFYELYAVEYLVNLQKKYNAEIVLSNIKLNGLDRNLIKEFKLDLSAITLSLEKSLENMYYGYYSGIHPAAKLYKKDCLLKFPYPEGKIHEDTDTAYKHLFYSKNNIVCGKLITYSHCKNFSSTTQGRFNDRMFYYFDAMKNNKNFINKEFNNNGKILLAWYYMYVIGGIRIYDSIIKSNMYDIYIKEFVFFIKEIRKYWRFILFNNKVSIKSKVKYILFTCNLYIYKKLLLKRK